MEAHANSMEADALQTDPLRADLNIAPRSPRDKGQSARVASWHSRLLALEKQLTVLHGLQAAQRCSESRVARVEELRAQVEAGIYKMNSTLIAESMLQNQAHSLEEDWD